MRERSSDTLTDVCIWQIYNHVAGVRTVVIYKPAGNFEYDPCFTSSCRKPHILNKIASLITFRENVDLMSTIVLICIKLSNVAARGC